MTRLIEICQTKIEAQGFVLIPNLDSDFDYQSFVSHWGPLMPQYDQNLHWNVQVKTGITDAKCSLGSVEVPPHTEYYEGELNPPHYLALWCIHPASCGGGKIAFADGYRFLETISVEEKKYLYQAQYIYRSEIGLRKINVDIAHPHCILTKNSSGKDILRFNTTGMGAGDLQFLCEFRKKFLKFYKMNRRELYQPKNSLLIWDNYRMVHARSSSFRDKKRHLVRLWIREKLKTYSRQ